MPQKATGNFYQGFASTNTGIRGTDIFSIGQDLANFSLQTNLSSRVVRDIAGNLNGFSQPITLATLKLTTSTSQTLLTNNVNIFLNYDKGNLRNYAYFGSLREFMRGAIESIITTFPASLYVSNQLDSSIMLTVLNYSYDDNLDTAQFTIPVSAIDNKYGLLITPQSTLLNTTSDIKNLALNYSRYVIWDFTNEYPILGYTATTQGNYINVSVQGNAFPEASFTGQLLINYHLKPSYNEYESFINGLDDFEAYLLNRDGNPKYSAIFKDVVHAEDGTMVLMDKVYVWKTTDGYNLDYDTLEYRQYLTSLLQLADDYDDYKTNLISRFLTTTSILEFDTPDHKVHKLLKIYGREFDEIKRFIDGLANINKVTYNKKDNIPDALVKNFAKTLGFGTFSTVSENDLMKSFLGEPNEIIFSGQTKNLTPAETDIELWRRLIINSAQLFKSKGTRKCIEFLFSIIGAPDSLIDFNEYVYLVDGKVNVNLIPNNTDLNYQFDSDGYPLIPTAYTSDYYFQMKGGWRVSIPLAPNNDKNLASVIGLHTGDYDNGKLFFDAFRSFDGTPGFTLTKTIDNVKSWPFSSSAATRSNLDEDTQYDIQESKLVLNTKELDVYLDPAKAIEYDTFQYIGANDYPINGISMTYPYPDSILTRGTVSNMSFIQYVDFVYSKFINAQNRKVISDNFGGSYPTLQKIYNDYYNIGLDEGDEFTNQFNDVFLVGVPPSRHLDYQKVQQYIKQINSFWLSLLEQFIPSTTIWSGGIKYRNTVFQRQKYVYRHGINDGSEFTTKININNNANINLVKVTGTANLPFVADIHNRVKINNTFTTTLQFPDDSDSGTTANKGEFRVRPWITGNTMVFSQPLYYILQAAKIQTGETETVRHNISLSAKSFNVIFTGNTTNMLTTNPNISYRFRLYPFDYSISAFTQNAVLSYVTSTDFVGQTGPTLTFNETIGANLSDGDYLIKSSFIKTGTSYNQFGYNFTPSAYTIDTEAFNSSAYYTYGIYDSAMDYWFTIISNPTKPQIDTTLYDSSTADPVTSGLTLLNKTISITGTSITAVTFNDNPLGDSVIVVNGESLYKASSSAMTDGDYFIPSAATSATSINIYFNNPLSSGRSDTLSIIYLKSTGSQIGSIGSETQTVNVIPSGSTDASDGSQTYYNTSTNLFEYYTAFPINGSSVFDSLIVVVNGVTLQPNIDYAPSLTNNHKIIFNGSINTGDTIIIYYPVLSGVQYLYLKSSQFNVKWTAVTNNLSGIFTVQVATTGDTNFTVPLYSITTPYVTGTTNVTNIYNVFVANITVPNEVFILRVKSDKYFINLLGEQIITTNYSDIITLKTDARVLR